MIEYETIIYLLLIIFTIRILLNNKTYLSVSRIILKGYVKGNIHAFVKLID